MSFSIERSAGVSTVLIVDELVAEDRPELRRAVLGELADGVSTVRFDFASAAYIDGAGLGVLVSISRLAREHAAEVRLASLNDDLRMLFTLTKLDTLFVIERNDDEGTASRAASLPPRPPTPSQSPTEDRPRP
jgi:anti-sigma B factor antagonist